MSVIVSEGWRAEWATGSVTNLAFHRGFHALNGLMVFSFTRPVIEIVTITSATTTTLHYMPIVAANTTKREITVIMTNDGAFLYQSAKTVCYAIKQSISSQYNLFRQKELE